MKENLMYINFIDSINKYEDYTILRCLNIPTCANKIFYIV